MPVTKSAEKALRSQNRKNSVNQRIRSEFRHTLKVFAKNKEASLLAQVYRVIDIAAKKRIIHKNKAARLKAQAARKVAPAKIA